MPKIADLPEVMRVIHDTIYKHRPKGVRSRHTNGSIKYLYEHGLLLSVAACRQDKNYIILKCSHSIIPAYVSLNDPDLFSKIDVLAHNAFAMLNWADSTEYWR